MSPDRDEIEATILGLLARPEHDARVVVRAVVAAEEQLVADVEVLAARGRAQPRVTRARPRR